MMNLSDAILVAASAVAALCPYCDRIEVAGSVRRKKRNPKDIEIVCIPKETPVSRDLFAEPIMQRDSDFCKVVNSWEKVKGEPTGRYTQRVIPDEDGEEFCKLDLFMCVKRNFGLMFAIRTGPAAFSHHSIAEGAHEVGMRIQGGMLTRDGVDVPVPDEETLFRLLKIAYLKPEERPG